LLLNKKRTIMISPYLKVAGEDVDRFILEEEEAEPLKEGILESLYQIDFRLSSSNSVHSVRILRDLYIDGKADFIMKVLI